MERAGTEKVPLGSFLRSDTKRERGQKTVTGFRPQDAGTYPTSLPGRHWTPILFDEARSGPKESAVVAEMWVLIVSVVNVYYEVLVKV